MLLFLQIYAEYYKLYNVCRYVDAQTYMHIRICMYICMTLVTNVTLERKSGQLNSNFNMSEFYVSFEAN